MRRETDLRKLEFALSQPSVSAQGGVRLSSSLGPTTAPGFRNQDRRPSGGESFQPWRVGFGGVYRHTPTNPTLARRGAHEPHADHTNPTGAYRSHTSLSVIPISP